VIKEDPKMKKALAGIVVVLFAGMLCGSMLAAFNSQNFSDYGTPSLFGMHPYTAY
jgi:hypothetical protein